MKKKIDKILEKVKLNKETSKRGWRIFSCDSCGVNYPDMNDGICKIKILRLAD